MLYDELREILTRSVCAWSGVPLAESEVDRRTRELTAMFQYAGSTGPQHWWSRRARTSAERWIADAIGEIRAGRLEPPEQSAAHVIAWHRSVDGELLSPRLAAVELLNVLRPTVAVAVYITFVAQALHEHPVWRRRLEAGQDGEADMFVQEVRRFYPFFPFVTALVRDHADWNGYRFPAGRRVLLDLHGTNHDPLVWKEPEKFRPERFRPGDPNPFTFIPQGGGDPTITHRCPGEPVAIALMKVAVDVLVRRIDYTVPAQDLRIDCSKLPALPRSRFIIGDVTPRA
ncbi:cytochrome P450 [Amycolatopsis sp. NPDC003865]